MLLHLKYEKCGAKYIVHNVDSKTASELFNLNSICVY